MERFLGVVLFARARRALAERWLGGEFEDAFKGMAEESER